MTFNKLITLNCQRSQGRWDGADRKLGLGFGKLRRHLLSTDSLEALTGISSWPAIVVRVDGATDEQVGWQPAPVERVGAEHLLDETHGVADGVELVKEHGHGRHEGLT